MIKVEIPGRGVLQIERLLLDLNGTLTLDGVLIEGVLERVKALAGQIEIQIVTADTLGSGTRISEELGIPLHKIGFADQQKEKLNVVKKLGAETTAAIGNGFNDCLMLGAAGLGICVVGPECVAAGTVAAADIVAPDINAALDLLLKPKRLIATLRR
jgi:soluble P-type ATPase